MILLPALLLAHRNRTCLLQCMTQCSRVILHVLQGECPGFIGTPVGGAKGVGGGTSFFLLLGSHLLGGGGGTAPLGGRGSLRGRLVSALLGQGRQLGTLGHLGTPTGAVGTGEDGAPVRSLLPPRWTPPILPNRSTLLTLTTASYLWTQREWVTPLGTTVIAWTTLETSVDCPTGLAFVLLNSRCAPKWTKLALPRWTNLVNRSVPRPWVKELGLLLLGRSIIPIPTLLLNSRLTLCKVVPTLVVLLLHKIATPSAK